MRVEYLVLAQINGVGVLNDASNLNVRKREGLRHILHALGLHNVLLEYFSVVACDRPVWSDSPGIDMHNIIPNAL